MLNSSTDGGWCTKISQPRQVDSLWWYLFFADITLDYIYVYICLGYL